jgi:cytidylate kinase
MAVRVVCISRALAAGGEDIGHAVAERLGFRCVDEEIVRKAAEKAGIDPKVVGESEHRQPLIKRLIDSIALSSPGPEALAYSAGWPVEFYEMGGPLLQPVQDDYRALIRDAIHEIAAEGNVVIVAHAASMALGDAESVLRVLVTASPETRARRLAAAEKSGEGDAAAAVKKSDRERRDYFKRFYGIGEELPTHYDLVVNTDKLGPEQAVKLILAAAGA